MSLTSALSGAFLKRVGLLVALTLASLALAASLPAVDFNADSGVAKIAMATGTSGAVSALTPGTASASWFSDYMVCITGVGVPAGVAGLLWPVRWAIARGWTGGPGANAAVAYYARRYGHYIRANCWRFLRS